MQYFRHIAQLDANIEITRQVLLSEPSFAPLACFLRLDKSRSGYISGKEILDYIHDNSKRSVFDSQDTDDLAVAIDEVTREDCEILIRYNQKGC